MPRGVTLEPAALALIVREAEGSVRDGLSLLDQILAYADKRITAADVADVLGLVGRDVLQAIARALLTGDRQAALARLGEAFQHGMDLKRFMADLLDCFRSLLLLRISGCEQLLDLPADEIGAPWRNGPATQHRNDSSETQPAAAGRGNPSLFVPAPAGSGNRLPVDY